MPDYKPYRVKYWINVGFRTKDSNIAFPYNGFPLETKKPKHALFPGQIEAHEHILELAEKLAPGERVIVSENQGFVIMICRTME